MPWLRVNHTRLCRLSAVPTPLLALEVQRGAIPGQPGANRSPWLPLTGISRGGVGIGEGVRTDSGFDFARLRVGMRISGPEILSSPGAGAAPMRGRHFLSAVFDLDPSKLIRLSMSPRSHQRPQLESTSKATDRSVRPT